MVDAMGKRYEQTNSANRKARDQGGMAGGGSGKGQRTSLHKLKAMGKQKKAQ